MMTKTLRITAAILFTLLMSIYSFFAFTSIFMLYIISFPSHDGEASIVDLQIGYAMFVPLLIISLICTISGLLYLYKKNINLIFILPVYLFLPISIPYLLLQMKIKNNREVYEINDSAFSVFLLTVTSIINYLLSLPLLILSIALLEVARWNPSTLYFSIPFLIISLSMIVGTTANIVSCRHEDLIAKRLAYIGFMLVWVYKAYKASLIRNNLYPIRTLKIKREREGEKIKAA